MNDTSKEILGTLGKLALLGAAFGMNAAGTGFIGELVVGASGNALYEVLAKVPLLGRAFRRKITEPNHHLGAAFSRALHKSASYTAKGDCLRAYEATHWWKNDTADTQRTIIEQFFARLASTDDHEKAADLSAAFTDEEHRAILADKSGTVAASLLERFRTGPIAACPPEFQRWFLDWIRDYFPRIFLDEVLANPEARNRWHGLVLQTISENTAILLQQSTATRTDLGQIKDLIRGLYLHTGNPSADTAPALAIIEKLTTGIDDLRHRIDSTHDRAHDAQIAADNAQTNTGILLTHTAELLRLVNKQIHTPGLDRPDFEQLARLSEKVDLLTVGQRTTTRWVIKNAALAALILVVLVGFIWWQKNSANRVEQKLDRTAQAITDVLAENRAIVAKVASLYNETTDLKETFSSEQKFDRAIQRTADAENLSKGDVLARVDSFIAGVRAREKEGRADFYDLGLAAFAEKNFTKATEFAVQAADAARKDRMEAKLQAATAVKKERTATIAERLAEKLAGSSAYAAIQYEDAIKHYRAAATLYDPLAEAAEWATAQSELAGALWRHGKYAEGARICETALEVRERMLGKEHPDTLETVNNLATLYADNGEATKAESLYFRALESLERTFGNEHPSTLTCMNNLAGLYAEKGEMTKAEPLFLRVLDTCERTLGKEHPATLISLNGLAAFYAEKGESAKAEPLFVRATEAFGRTLGKEHPFTLISLNGLGKLYLRKGEMAKAEPLFLRALEAQEKLLGKDHPDTLATLGNLGYLYNETGVTAKAEALYIRAMEAQERTLGADHPATLTSVNNLALLYKTKGATAKAEALYLRTLDSREKTLGKEHPDTLASVNNLGALYYAKREMAKAEPLLLRSMEVFGRTFGDVHPSTLTSSNNLAELYNAVGETAKAEALHLRTLEIRERTLGKEHPDTLASVNNLAELYHNVGEAAKAESFYLRALEARERTLGKEHPDTILIVSNLAFHYSKNLNLIAAEPLFRRALEVQERILGGKHPDTLTNVNNLGALYCRTKDFAGAEPLCRRASSGHRQASGAEHPNTCRANYWLSVALHGLKKNDEAKPLVKEAYDGLLKSFGPQHQFTKDAATLMHELGETP